ncbi:hypothetical protein N7523_001134 [Penicillium sp. IBT 18751x]|nr:hypothetical protein N7523_001134 [Penicillium sp. IBT 18751x]
MKTSDTSLDPRNTNARNKSETNYKLLVMAGSSYDERYHRIVTVNDSESLLIDGPHMAINLHVRVRDYDGLPLHSPRHSCYFDHEMHQRDLYSIAFSFIPKKNIKTNSLVWGNDFDHPIRDQLPPGFNIAYKIAKTLIDPGIDCDAYSNRPWSYGPALSCWFPFRVGERQQYGDQMNEGKSGSFQHRSPRIADQHVIEEGADGDGRVIRERFGIPENAKKRRKHFLSISNRKAFNFEAGRVYHADFYNPYFDPNKVLLRLPGIKIRVLKYVNEKTHTLRYVFKDRENGEVYLVVLLKLLFGQELTNSVEE